jgi:uncharacterized protein YkwD
MRNPLPWMAAFVLLLSSFLLTGTAADKDEAPAVKLSKEEKAILDLTNAERAKENLAALKANAILCEVARAHTVNMGKQKKLEHELDGKTPTDRVRASEYKLKTAGENIAINVKQSPQQVMQMWMKSAIHKANILSEYEEIGLGIVRGADNKYYYTQLFASPKP